MQGMRSTATWHKPRLIFSNEVMKRYTAMKSSSAGLGAHRGGMSLTCILFRYSTLVIPSVLQEAEAAAVAAAAELAEIRAKASFILNHLQPPVSAAAYVQSWPLLLAARCICAMSHPQPAAIVLRTFPCRLHTQLPRALHVLQQFPTQWAVPLA